MNVSVRFFADYASVVGADDSLFRLDAQQQIADQVFDITKRRTFFYIFERKCDIQEEKKLI